MEIQEQLHYQSLRLVETGKEPMVCAKKTLRTMAHRLEDSENGIHARDT